MKYSLGKMFLYFQSGLVFLIFLCVKIKGALKYNTVEKTFSRATVHRSEVLDKTCLLKPDVGPCRAEITMYYYEPSSGGCTTFMWGGCQGNGNRFDSRGECMKTCLSRANTPKRRPTYCSLTFDYGFCFGAYKRWYYDPLWKTCKERIYSGCGGNKNNFYNKEQCDAICRFNTGPRASVTTGKSNIKKVLIVDGAPTKRARIQPLSNSNLTNKLVS